MATIIRERNSPKWDNATNKKVTKTKEASNKRVGIYGGSFNPIHVGHFDTAKFLLDNGYLDEVRFLLNPCSPFKKRSQMPDAYYRAKAILHGINWQPEKYKEKLCLDTTEMMDSIQTHVCYTVNTLKKILYTDIENKTFNEYFLIVGADVFNDIKKFKNWQWFLEEKLVKFIVLPRGGYETDEVLYEEFKELIENIDYSKFKPIELSSTEVRNVIASGNDKRLEEILVPGTHAYIVSKKMYGYPNDNYVVDLPRLAEYALEKQNDTEPTLKTYSADECKKMFKSIPEMYRYNVYEKVENSFMRVYTTISDGYTRANIYDFSKGIPISDVWFHSIGEFFTYDTRTNHSGKRFRKEDYVYYNTRMFNTDDTFYFAFVEIPEQVYNTGTGSTSWTKANILKFNHNTCKCLFNDNMYNGYTIIEVMKSGIYGHVILRLSNNHKVEYSLLTEKEVYLQK